jgi:Tfp pilus assembly protein PilF
MFSIDDRLRGLPAVKEQVVQLFQSLNQPHLAVPGHKAGPSSAFVLGLRGPSGFAVFVYLYLHESGECAVYVPSNGTVVADRYQGEESEALGFVESMGFIMDNLNFRGRPGDEQETLLRTLPVFQREPPPPQAAPATAVAQATVSRPGTGKNASLLNLGRLFGAFCLTLLLGAACTHVDPELSSTHYQLGLGELLTKPTEAFAEAEEAIKLDPSNWEAWHLKAILLHNTFGRLDEARVAYQKALELNPKYSDAHTNYGNLLMDLKRYDESISQYELALSDVTYNGAALAHGNMGWAYYRKGDAKQATEHLKMAVTMSPKYCLGYLHLGMLYEEQSNAEFSCKYFTKFRESCPERADAWQHDGVCLARVGKRDEAAKAFSTCIEKTKDDDLSELCGRLKKQL